MGAWGCVALGSLLGIVAGVLAAAAFHNARKRLTMPTDVWPVGEASILLALYGFTVGGCWAISRITVVTEPLYGDLYFIVACLWIVIFSAFQYFRLLLDYAARDHLASAQPQFGYRGPDSAGSEHQR